REPIERIDKPPLVPALRDALLDGLVFVGSLEALPQRLIRLRMFRHPEQRVEPRVERQQEVHDVVLRRLAVTRGARKIGEMQRPDGPLGCAVFAFSRLDQRSETCRSKRHAPAIGKRFAYPLWWSG